MDGWNNSTKLKNKVTCKTAPNSIENNNNLCILFMNFERISNFTAKCLSLSRHLNLLLAPPFNEKRMKKLLI